MLNHKSSESIDSHIEAKIREWEKNLEADEQVMVEGGHFTIQFIDNLSLPVVIIRKPDTLYLLELEPGASDPPFQTFRATAEGRDYSIVDPPEHEMLDSRRIPGLMRVHELKFEPSATEVRSFRHAVATVSRLKSRSARAVPALFIGDIRLPTAIKDFIRKGSLLPASYRFELQRYGLANELVLFLESLCRNWSKDHILNRAKRENPAEKQEIYRQRGYTIFSYHNIYSLAGDYFIQRERFPYIPLTKNAKNAPTCALILAGKYLTMAREGFTQVLAIYDKRDDAEIRIKNVEGMIIASYASHIIGDPPLKCTILTVDHMSRESVLIHPIEVSEVLSGERRCGTYQELVETALRRDPGAAAEQCYQDTCSVQRPSRLEAIR